jgi:hypothetical protein
MASGAGTETAARSTAISIDAMPRTAAPGAPPQATTDSTARLAGTPAASKRST